MFSIMKKFFLVLQVKIRPKNNDVFFFSIPKLWKNTLCLCKLKKEKGCHWKVLCNFRKWCTSEFTGNLYCFFFEILIFISPQNSAQNGLFLNKNWGKFMEIPRKHHFFFKSKFHENVNFFCKYLPPKFCKLKHLFFFEKIPRQNTICLKKQN